MSKKLTIGMILSIIMIAGFLFFSIWATALVVKDPTDPKNVQKVVEKGTQMIVDEATPQEASIIINIVEIFGGGVFAAVLILLAVGLWGKIVDFNVLPFLEDFFDLFGSSRSGSL